MIAMAGISEKQGGIRYWCLLQIITEGLMNIAGYTEIVDLISDIIKNRLTYLGDTDKTK